MKHFLLLVAAALLWPGSVTGAFIVTGVYDEQTTQTNAVDFEATGDADTLANLKTRIATAFANGTGGVVDFDNGVLEGTNNLNIVATYGTAGEKKVTFTSTGTNLTLTQSSASASVSISGGTELGMAPKNLQLGVGAFNSSGGAADTGIASLAFTVLGRAGIDYGTVTGVITFSDGSTASASRAIASTSSNAPSNDTLFSYVAPAGKTISSLALGFTAASSFLRLDDLAFTTVTTVTPPVSTTALYNYTSTVTVGSNGPLHLTAELVYTGAVANQPIMVLMHPFTDLSGQFAAYTDNAALWRDAGFFVILPAMRQREGSEGTRDNGGVEIYDIYDAVEAVKRDFAGLVDPTCVSITGYSGGGGNTMSALTKFPDYFRTGGAFFGISDYGYNTTSGWWYNDAPSSQSADHAVLAASPGDPTTGDTLVADRYQARASNLASRNNPYAEIHLFVNSNETRVPPIHDTSFRDFAQNATGHAYPNITVHMGASAIYQDFNANGANDPNELQYWPHGDPTANQQQAGDLWYRDRLFARQIPEPVLRAADTLFLAGFVKTKKFRLWLGDGQNGAGNLIYSLSPTLKRFELHTTTLNAVTGQLTVDTADMTGATVEVLRNGAYVGSFTGGSDYVFPAMATNDVIEIKVTTAVDLWRDQNFGAGNPPGSGDLEDYDGDGLVNLAEFAFALNPKAPGVAPTAVTTVGGQARVQLTYRQREGGAGALGVDYTAAGVRYTAQTSSDLVTWTSGAVSEVGGAASNGDGTQTVTVRATTADRFIRLLITRVN